MKKWKKQTKRIKKILDRKVSRRKGLTTVRKFTVFPVRSKEIKLKYKPQRERLVRLLKGCSLSVHWIALHLGLLRNELSGLAGGNYYLSDSDWERLLSGLELLCNQTNKQSDKV